MKETSKKAIITFPGKQWETASPESQGLDPEKVAAAAEHVRNVSGKAGADEFMIIRNGYVVYQGKRIDRLQPIHSCTKSFSSSCFGLLWDDDLFKPDDKVCDHWPPLKEKYPDVTIEHMLTLKSGYRSGKNAFEPQEPAFAPGTALEYSNQADLLMAVFTQKTGKSMADLFMERIGGPIGIDPREFKWGTTRTLNGLHVNGGGGAPPTGVSATARALARFGWLYCNLGKWDGKQLISRRYVDYATVPRTSVNTPPHDPAAWYNELPGNYGLHWWTNGPRPDGPPHWPSAPAYTFAAQGNCNSLCFVVPEWRMVIVRLGNDKIIPMTDYDEMFRLIKEGLLDSDRQ